MGPAIIDNPVIFLCTAQLINTMAYSLETKQKIDEIKAKTGPKPRSVEERFWERVDKRGEDECWPWSGGTRNGTNYGYLSDGMGGRIGAHRLSFQIHNYPISNDEWVMRTCEDITCVNPKHLYIGNRYDWAKKHHMIDPTEEHVVALKEKAIKRAREHYVENAEKIKKSSRERQRVFKQKAIDYLGGKCIRCGFDEHPAALQFHHRDPSSKSFSVTTKELTSPGKFPWETVVLPELDKCDLLCANCHFVTHCKWEV